MIEDMLVAATVVVVEEVEDPQEVVGGAEVSGLKRWEESLQVTFVEI